MNKNNEFSTIRSVLCSALEIENSDTFGADEIAQLASVKIASLKGEVHRCRQAALEGLNRFDAPGEATYELVEVLGNAMQSFRSEAHRQLESAQEAVTMAESLRTDCDDLGATVATLTRQFDDTADALCAAHGHSSDRRG